MADQTLNNPLSGEEVIESFIDRIRTQLKADCHLNKNSAYDWYSASFSYSIDLHDAGAHVKVDQTVTVKAHGIVPDMEDGNGQHVEGEFHVDPGPPNEVREQTGLPIPTLTKDDQGRQVVKGVRYSRKGAKSVAAIAVIFFAAHIVMAQAGPHLPAKPTAIAPPAPSIVTSNDSFSYVEAVAVQSVIEEYRVARVHLHQTEEDIAKAHPGYHLDEQVMKLVKNPEPEKPKIDGADDKNVTVAPAAKR